MRIRRRIVIIGLIVLILFNVTTSSFSEEEYGYKSFKLTKEEIDFLQEHKIFYYSIVSDYAPIEYIDPQGNPRGFGVEYLKKASEILNVEFLPVEGFEDYSWEDCLNGLKTGELDLLPTISNTKSRREYVYFTDIYLQANIIVVGNDGKQIILDVGDMEGATFVLPKKYWQNEYIKSNLDQYKIINTENAYEALKLIDGMKGDYIFLESTVYDYYNQLGSFKNLRIAGELDIHASHGIGVSRENKLLRDILNKVIKYIPKDEVYKKAMIIEPRNDDDHLFIVLVLISILMMIIILLVRKIIKNTQYKKQIRENKQTLIENLSHDLKTPLSVLKVNVALLRKGILDKKQEKNQLEVIDNSIDSLNFIIEDLYALTHIKDSLIEKNLTLINVSKFLKEIYNQYKDVFHERNRELILKESYESKLVNINIDKTSIHRAISNLLANALKFTDDFDHTIIRYWVENNKVIITITDNGQGIDKHSVKHIFDRFYQSDNNSSALGKGLGLPIAKEIIEFHRGEISVSSKKGEFTTFTIKLPISRSKDKKLNV